MVLLGTQYLDSAFALLRGVAKRGFPLEALRILALQGVVFSLCKACVAMSCYPPAMFSVKRTRDKLRERDMKMAINNSRADEPKFFDTSFMTLTPLKYNSKLMNSIWGFYNRYSPHNVKKINDVFSLNVECQQSAGNSTKKAESVIILPPNKFDKVWAAIKVSQSH